MELDDAKGLPSQMGLMGSSIYHVPFLSASEWEPSRGSVHPQTGGQTRLPFGSSIHAGSRSIS